MIEWLLDAAQRYACGVKAAVDSPEGKTFESKPI